MGILIALSFISLLVCIWLTIYAASKAEAGLGQSIRESMIEAWTNIAVGFSINYVANLLILPMVAQGLDPVENFLIGWIYTAISMVRSFVIRRWHNKITLRRIHEKSTSGV